MIEGPCLGTSEPLVSVVIPTFEREKFIQRSVTSVLTQSLDDFELIIVDDHSQDGTAEVVNRINDPRIRYIHNKTNLGGSGSRNAGIEAARGRYIAFLDDDDEWLPEKLAMQVEMLESDLDLAMVYTGYKFLNNNTREVYQVVSPKTKVDIKSDLLRKNIIGTTSTAMVRRECLEVVKGFDPMLRGCQDWDLWLRISMRFRIAAIASPLVLFYDHNERISQNIALKIEAKKKFFEKHKVLISKSRKAKSYHHFKIGQLICQNGAASVGRSYLWLAITTHPFTPLYYKHLFCSFLGDRYYILVLKFKRQAAIWARKL